MILLLVGVVICEWIAPCHPSWMLGLLPRTTCVKWWHSPESGGTIIPRNGVSGLCQVALPKQETMSCLQLITEVVITYLSSVRRISIGTRWDFDCSIPSWMSSLCAWMEKKYGYRDIHPPWQILFHWCKRKGHIHSILGSTWLISSAGLMDRQLLYLQFIAFWRIVWQFPMIINSSRKCICCRF